LNDGKVDVGKAFDLLQTSGLEGCKEALRELGFVYERGGLEEGLDSGRFVALVDVDLDKAQDFYGKAANQGDELALNYLGSFYFNHFADHEKAVSLFREACKSRKCGRALNNLGLCFEQGVGGVAQDYDQAVRLYEESAKQGYHQAWVNLAYLFYKLALQGHLDSEELYFQCASNLRRAILKDAKNVEALVLLAKLHLEGLAVDRNPELARTYYQKAADLGCGQAWTQLGHLYYSGQIST